MARPLGLLRGFGIFAILVLLLSSATLSGCSDTDDAQEAEGGVPAEVAQEEVPAEPTEAPTARISPANFDESLVMAEVYAQALEDAGYDVVMAEALPVSNLPSEVEDGGADVVPLYSPDPVPLGGVKLEAAPASNDAVLIVGGADAKEYGLETLADLSRVPGARPKFLAHDAAPGWAGGGLFSASASASPEATSGFPETLETAYGLSDVAVEQVPDLSARYDDLASEATNEEPGVTVAEGYSSDGRVAEEGFVVLKDPENVVSGAESYHPVPVVNEEWLSRNPSAEDALNEASGKLDLPEMQALNAALLDGTEPQDAVARWREANGL